MPHFRDTPSEHQDIDLAEFGESVVAKVGACAPGVVLIPQEGIGYAFAPPVEDQPGWEARVRLAFGARRLSVATAFLNQLIDLCTVSYDVPNERWKPSELELNFAVELISSIRPRNQMEAALAAQMVAVHFMQMRMSARTLAEQHIEARDVAVAGKLARTFAIQMDTLAKMRGRGTAKQSIKVRKDNHVHYHVHRGRDETGAEPRAPRALTEPARLAAKLPALPGDDAIGAVVPIASRQRQASV